MTPWLILGAFAVAPFSGVDIDTLLDRPMFIHDQVVGLTPAEMAAAGAAVEVQMVDGADVALTRAGFEIVFQQEFPAARYLVTVEAQAPNNGTDSLWVDLDGERIESPLVLPIGNFQQRFMPVDIAQAGVHTIRVSLREGPGAQLRRAGVSTVTTKIPQPPMREELLRSHPRILFTRDDIPRLRERLNHDTVKRFYKLPGLLTRKPPEYKPGSRNGGSFRDLGSHALAYVLDGNPDRLQPIFEWLDVGAEYGSVGVDLDGEYFMEGMALCYDWLYDQMPEELRNRVRDRLAAHCREVYKASLAGMTGGGQHFQQNHYWFAHLSLAMPAAAICGEVPEADRWLAWAWDRFERIALSFSPDGSFHEGPSYWDFSMPTLYLYTDLYEWCTGLNVPAADTGLHGQAGFRFNYLYPGLNLSASMEDAPVTLKRPPIRLILWEAKRFKDPLVMGMAEKLVGEPASDRFNLLWLDETITPVDPLTELPLGRYYQDVETAFARTSWAEDGTGIAFVSRPLGGHLWAELCEKYGLGGTGHNHPAQNHFVLFARGEVLAGDPGYTYEKKTRNHNTVLVDGQGQYGDGEMWPSPKPGRAHITGFVNDGDVTIVAGNAQSAYPKELGLTRFDRTFVLAGRDLVVVHDRLGADAPRTFSWLFHHWGETAAAQSRWTITRNAAQVTIAPLKPAGVMGESTTYRPQFVHPTRDLTPENAEINMLELKTAPTAEATFLVPLLVADAGASAPEVTDLSTDTFDALRVGDTVVVFNRGDAEIAAPTASGDTLTTTAGALVTRMVNGHEETVALPAAGE